MGGSQPFRRRPKQDVFEAAWLDTAAKDMHGCIKDCDDFGLLIKIAEQCAANEDWYLAEEALRRALAQSPRDAVAWRKLGRVMIELGKCSDASVCRKNAQLVQPMPFHVAMIRIARQVGIGPMFRMF